MWALVVAEDACRASYCNFVGFWNGDVIVLAVVVVVIVVVVMVALAAVAVASCNWNCRRPILLEKLLPIHGDIDSAETLEILTLLLRILALDRFVENVVHLDLL